MQTLNKLVMLYCLITNLSKGRKPEVFYSVFGLQLLPKWLTILANDAFHSGLQEIF